MSSSDACSGSINQILVRFCTDTPEMMRRDLVQAPSVLLSWVQRSAIALVSQHGKQICQLTAFEAIRLAHAQSGQRREPTNMWQEVSSSDTCPGSIYQILIRFGTDTPEVMRTDPVRAPCLSLSWVQISAGAFVLQTEGE